MWSHYLSLESPNIQKRKQTNKPQQHQQKKNTFQEIPKFLTFLRKMEPSTDHIISVIKTTLELVLTKQEGLCFDFLIISFSFLTDPFLLLKHSPRYKEERETQLSQLTPSSYLPLDGSNYLISSFTFDLLRSVLNHRARKSSQLWVT